MSNSISLEQSFFPLLTKTKKFSLFEEVLIVKADACPPGKLFCFLCQIDTSLSNYEYLNPESNLDFESLVSETWYEFMERGDVHSVDEFFSEEDLALANPKSKSRDFVDYFIRGYLENPHFQFYGLHLLKLNLIDRLVPILMPETREEIFQEAIQALAEIAFSVKEKEDFTTEDLNNI